jgi:hypothetical protein
MSKAKLSASEWELVKDAPYWVNAALAAADGRVAFVTSRREAKELNEAISRHKSSNALVRDIVASESDPAKEVKTATQSSAEKALSQIATIVKQKLGDDDLDALNDFLLQVGQAVAAAAGERLLGLGDNVSKREAAALAGIAEALKATETHKEERRQDRQHEEQARRETAAKAAAEAKAAEAKEAAAAKAAEAKAKAEAEAKAKEEEAEKAKAAAEIQAKMKAEREKREAEAEARQAALAKEKAEREARAAAEAKEKAEREAAAKAAAEAKAAEEARAAEAARAAAEAQAAAAAQFIAEHKVVSGDNLSMISQRYYGTQVNWRYIYEANKEVIGDNPSLIRVGQVLRIPKL